MKHTAIALILFGLLCSCVKSSHYETDPNQIEAEPVFPDSLTDKKPYELGEAILLFMPTEQGGFSWGYRADTNDVYWLTDGYKEAVEPNGKQSYYRNGLLRIHVQGSKVYRLKRVKHELGWTVRYTTKSNPRFGVEIIELYSGIPEDYCFGSLDTDCTFDPIQSLKASKINVKEICHRSEPGTNVIGYQLSHPERKLVTARLMTSTGSGGASTSFELISDSAPKVSVCDDFFS